MLRPFGSAQDRQAQHERKIDDVFNVSSVRHELVEGLAEGFSAESQFELCDQRIRADN